MTTVLTHHAAASPSSSSVTSTSPFRIRVLGIADSGAKSRVETQMRLCLELVNDDNEKVQDWTHLHIPDALLTHKRRHATTATMTPPPSKRTGANTANAANTSDATAQETVIEPPEPEKVLTLHASIVCESDIHRKVKMCHRCVVREWKRADRKKAGRKMMDSFLYDGSLMEKERKRILIFNSEPTLSFHQGECILPTRITCYSRHHDERQGFRIKFALHDHEDRLVATGQSPPVMITDDHKNLSKLGDKQRRRRKTSTTTTCTKRNRSSTATGASSASGASGAVGATSSRGRKVKQESLPTPKEELLSFDDIRALDQQLLMEQEKLLGLDPVAQPNGSALFASTAPNASSNLLVDPYLVFSTSPTDPMAAAAAVAASSSLWQSSPLLDASSSPSDASPELYSPLSSSPSSPLSSAARDDALFQHQQSAAAVAVASVALGAPSGVPAIDRLVPHQGEAGSEITVLGQGFYEGLTCYFGNQPALTTYWNPTTLVCTVPPQQAATILQGPVTVAFHDSSFIGALASSAPPVVFTYTSSNASSTTSSASSSPSASFSALPTTISPADTTNGYLAWNEHNIQMLTWQVLNLSMAPNVHEARQIALRLMELQQHHT
ncbi:hypothetical protein BC940DRAFT_330452 [Gongronella butleri]|nr:hypothetical protein BC940DRAFT_330452 [Gongronella butleri]